VPRVLIAVTGSFGDLNPMLAIGEQLLDYGVKVAVATYPCYAAVCQKNGFEFVPLGGPESYANTLRLSRHTLGNQGFEQIVDRVNFDQLDLQYAQLLAAASRADILVGLSHVAPAHLVAEKLKIPYVATAVCLIQIKSIAPVGTDDYRRMAASVARWHSSLRRLREEQQLERRVLPFASLISDTSLLLGVLPSFLLSESDLRIPKLDVVGYAEHRQTEWMAQDDELRAFCDERTVAFSFGSYADSCDPKYFLQESVAACRALDLKCVFLSQHMSQSMLEANHRDVLIRNNLAPAAVFPLVGIVVHHGGSGNLVVACRHFKPMVIVPFFLDQPQQAARMNALIGAPVVPAAEYHCDSAVHALRAVLDQSESMRSSLRALMANYSDGAVRGAQRILALMN
jgi:rhamnosyltransferase subunit B